METPAEMNSFKVGRSEPGSVWCKFPSENESGVRLRIAMICVVRVGDRDDIGAMFGEIGVSGDIGDRGLGSLRSCTEKFAELGGGGKVASGIRLCRLTKAFVYTRREISYSQRGLRTNSRSRILSCGMTRRLWSTCLSSYSKISRSIARGPFSTVFCLPRAVSMSLSLSSKTKGSKVVRTCGQHHQFDASTKLIFIMSQDEHTSQTPLTKDGCSSRYIGSVS